MPYVQPRAVLHHKVACRDIVKGKPNPLVSSFKLSYYTLLNLLRRVEGSGHDMEYVIRNSFQQFQFEQSLPEVRAVLPFSHSPNTRSTGAEVFGRGARVLRAACAAAMTH